MSKAIFATAAICALLAVTGCVSPVNGEAPDGYGITLDLSGFFKDGGQPSVTVQPSENGLAVVPPPIQSVSDYSSSDYIVVALTGPGSSQSHTVKVSQPTLTTRVRAGVWTVTADAYTLVGGVYRVVKSASGSMEIGAGKANALELTLEIIPLVHTVAINPPAVTLSPGGSFTFAASVDVSGLDISGTNAPAQTVTWSVTGSNPAGSSTIDNTGLLTVGGGETAASLTVTAVSTADSSRYGAATVTIGNLISTPADLAAMTGSPGGTYYRLTTDIVVTTSIQLTIPGGDTIYLDGTNSPANFSIRRGAATLTGGDGILLDHRGAGNLVLTNITLDGDKTTYPGGTGFLLQAASNGTTTLGSGAVIKDNADGGVLTAGYVAVGNLIMEAGSSITGNSSFEGAGVNMNGGNFTMNGGTISANTATAGSGGGIWARYDAVFTMNNGSITGNSAPAGGGVMLSNQGTGDTPPRYPRMIMTGGSITSNSATSGSGGGVYLGIGRSLTLSGSAGTGSIAGNTAAAGQAQVDSSDNSTSPTDPGAAAVVVNVNGDTTTYAGGW